MLLDPPRHITYFPQNDYDTKSKKPVFNNRVSITFWEDITELSDNSSENIETLNSTGHVIIFISSEFPILLFLKREEQEKRFKRAVLYHNNSSLNPIQCNTYYRPLTGEEITANFGDTEVKEILGKLQLTNGAWNKPTSNQTTNGNLKLRFISTRSFCEDQDKEIGNSDHGLNDDDVELGLLSSNELQIPNDVLCSPLVTIKGSCYVISICDMFVKGFDKISRS